MDHGEEMTLLGRWALRAIAMLVPRGSRSDWIEEFSAEISAALKQGVATGRMGEMRMLGGALSDAYTTRKLANELAVARGYVLTGTGGMEAVWQELRQAARALIVRPGFTVVTILTLGLGVGATTAMFSAVNAVLLRPLPYQDADRVVVLRRRNPTDGSPGSGVSASNMRDLSERSRALSQVAVADGIHGLRFVEDGKAESLRTWWVSSGFFQAIGADAQLGRTFLAEEFVPGNESVVILSERTWQARFGGAPDIVGRSLVLDDVAHTVVGVLASGFGYPSHADVWTPRPPQPRDAEGRAVGSMEGVARLAPGVTIHDAQQEVDRIVAELAVSHPAENAAAGVQLIPLRTHLFGDVQSPLMLLLGAVALVLLIAAANVAGLQVARGATRSREFALRGALGASSGRILRLVLMESLLLAGTGGLLGVGLAYAGVALIGTLGPDHLPRIDELGIDATVLSFAALAAVGSALIAGLTPASRASKSDLKTAMADGSRGNTGGPRGGGLRDRLVVAEIAVALVLAIGAGLLVRSLDQVLKNELGFDPDGRLTFQVWAYNDRHQAELSFFDEAVAQIRALPGVEAVGLTSDLPLADGELILAAGRETRFDLGIGTERGRPDAPTAGWVGIDSGYASAMGISVLDGRNFTDQDRSESPRVAMVNEAFVRRHGAGRDPVGASVTPYRGSGETRQIVGVLADVRRQGFESEPRPEIYVPLAQEPSNGLTFVAVFETDPAMYAGVVRETLWAVDPDQAIWAIRPMNDMLSDWTRQRRFNTVLLTAFAALALALAAVGVFGLMAFSIEQRINELGVRRALGGGTGDILAVVLRRALTLAVIGVGIGLLGSAMLTRLLRGMLFGVGPFDPMTFTLLSVLVVLSAVAAALVPAARATRIDPMVALSRGD